MSRVGRRQGSTEADRRSAWLILRDRFPSAEHLAGSDVPVRVLYGTADDVVPSRLSAELAARVGNLQGEVAVPGAGHNDAIWFGPRLADEVVELSQAVVD